MLRVRVRASVRPSEDPEKVRQAILKLFPTASVRASSDGFEADVPDTERLRELVRSQRIPDTARGAMLAGLEDDFLSTRFRLGKQAAAAGRAHFGVVRGPLGELDVELRGDEEGEVERAIYRLAPDTTVEPDLAEVPWRLRPAPE